MSTPLPPPSAPAARTLSSWGPFVAVVLAYAVVALQQLTLPGVYMDAVNPDYMVVRMLNRHAQPITAWLLPGNYLFEKMPVLISFYHGSQQFWLGLPFFWLFGTSVTGLRLTHALFALGLLAALYALLARGGLKPWQAALACAALAIDPGFSYAFRTQSYITLAPAAWLFLSLYSLLRATQSSLHWRRWLFASGVFYGWAVTGYFIYAFFLPALLLALRQWWPAAARPGAAWLLLTAGVAIGGIFYPLGYWLTIQQLGGVNEAWSYFQQTQKALNAFGEQPDMVTRIAHVWATIGSVYQNWFHHALIFGEHQPVPGAALKMALLIAVPGLLWIRLEWQRRAPALLRILIALVLSFVAVALVFGTRLSGHHFMVLLPLSYAALAVASSAVATPAPAWRRASVVFVVPFAVLVALNVGGQVKEGLRLHETRGVGLYSDAINQLADELDEGERKPFVYFPDWGLSMPVAFLTGGRVGMDSIEDFAAARRRLCEGGDVAVAVIHGDRLARIETWRQAMRWDAPMLRNYRQGNGEIAFSVATFGGRRDAPACPGR